MSNTPKFPVGARVLVPASKLSSAGDSPFALRECKVKENIKRSIRIDIQDAVGNDIILASRFAHPDSTRVLVLRIGDLSTDRTLLRPLQRNVLSFLDLLIQPDRIDHEYLRTPVELETFWASKGSSATHVVLVGHGTSSAVSHLGGRWSAGELTALFDSSAPEAEAKVFLSLACETGKAGFSKEFSAWKGCSTLIAPYQSIHGAAAAQFAVALFARHFLAGDGLPAAFASANALADGSHFRLWRRGILTGKESKI